MTNAERLAEIINRYEAAKPWMAEDFRSDTEFILNHIDRQQSVVEAAEHFYKFTSTSNAIALRDALAALVLCF